MDCRGIFVGNWLNGVPVGPSPQRVQGLLDRWSRVTAPGQMFELKDVDGSPTGPRIRKDNPTWGQIVEDLSETTGVTAATVFVFYYVGHSVPHGSHSLSLHFSRPKGEDAQRLPIASLVSELSRHGINRVVIIVDACHSGRMATDPALAGIDYYVAMATGFNYTFNGLFSDALLRSMERPLSKSDKRIDRRQGGITWKKIIARTRSTMLQSGTEDEDLPREVEAQELGSQVLYHVPLEIPEYFIEYNGGRTLYGRVRKVLSYFQGEEFRVAQIKSKCSADPLFLIEKEKDGRSARYIGGERIATYLSFLQKLGWLSENAGRYVMTERGGEALDGPFNRLLLEDIETKVLPDGLTLELLDKIIDELLENQIPTSPANIAEEARGRGYDMELSSAVRFGLQVLPSTNRYLGATSDSLFPGNI